MADRQAKHHETSTYSLYSQVICEGCGQAVYKDEARSSSQQDPVCPDCHAATTVPSRPWVVRFYAYRVPGIGLSITEILAVSLVLGMLASVVVPPLAGMKEKTDQYSLELLFYQNDDPEVTELALNMLQSRNNIALENLVLNAAQVAGVSSLDLADFKAELNAYKDYDSREVQAGAIIKTIEQWRTKLENRPEQGSELLPDLP